MIKVIIFILLTSCLSYRAKLNGNTISVSSTTTTTTLPLVPTQDMISVKSYMQTVHPLLVQNCQTCHNALAPIAPPFAAGDPIISHRNLLSLGKVAYPNVQDSLILQKVQESHNKSNWNWKDENLASKELLSALEKWRPYMNTERLTPQGIITDEALISLGEDIERNINGNLQEGKSIQIAIPNILNSYISFDIYPHPADDDYYQIENLEIQTADEPVALKGIAIHINKNLNKSHTDFTFISDVIAIRTLKKLNYYYQDSESPDSEDNIVKGKVKRQTSFLQDTVMVSFQKILIYK